MKCVIVVILNAFLIVGYIKGNEKYQMLTILLISYV